MKGRGIKRVATLLIPLINNPIKGRNK